MRLYDSADYIVYVRLGQRTAAPAQPAHVQDECRRLPAGYANTSVGLRVGRPGAAHARPALVLLPGGSAAADSPDRASAARRLSSSSAS
jgi:hypothetical protein